MSYRVLIKDYSLAWLALVLIGLYCRPLTPVDETRAVSVAWEMWQRHDFLVPYLNGETYSHKPPLLQWCIHLMWLVFGVGESSARLVAPLFALGNLALSTTLARRLWQDHGAGARLVPWLLIAMPLWGMWTSLTLYDMLITFFTLIGLHGVIRAARGQGLAGWSLVGLAIGGGVLAKGPVILLLILPVALLSPWWCESRPADGWGRWYWGLTGAMGLGTLIGLCWAIPAGIAGGEEYRHAIFWGQSAGRIASSFAHRRPLWWYLEVLPIALFPWVLWPPLLRTAKRVVLDEGLRFCILHALSLLTLLSLISGKQPHYLLPMFPSLALLAARVLSRGSVVITRGDQRLIGLSVLIGGLILVVSPWLDTIPAGPSIFQTVSRIGRQAGLAAKLILIAVAVALLLWRPKNMQSTVRGVAVGMLGVLLAVHLLYREVGWHLYDMRPLAERLSAVEGQGVPIAHWGKYHGDFNFLGRLHNPLLEIGTRADLMEWIRSHPEGYVVLAYRPAHGLREERADFAQPYRGSRRVVLWRVSELMAQPNLLNELMD